MRSESSEEGRVERRGMAEVVSCLLRVKSALCDFVAAGEMRK
jgi:hypothetical protein